MQKLHKKGMNANYVRNIIYVIIIMIVLFGVIAVILPEAGVYGDQVESSGVPLGSLFAAGGVVFLLVMAGILLVTVNTFIKNKK